MTEDVISASKVESTNPPVLVLDESGKVISSNPPAQRLLRLSEQELASHLCQPGPLNSEFGSIQASGSAPTMMVLLDEAGNQVDLRGVRVALDPAIAGRRLDVLILDVCGGEPPLAMANLNLDGLATEVRSPLFAIVGQLDLLLERHASIGRSALKMLGSLRRSARLLEHMVDDLVTLLDILSGRLALAQTPVPLARLLEEAAGEAAALAGGEEHNLTLVLPSAEAGAFVWADRPRALQAIVDLLSHALELSRGNRVTLSATPRAGFWRIGIAAPSNVWASAGGLTPKPGDRGRLRLAVGQAIITLLGGSLEISSAGERDAALFIGLPDRRPGRAS